MKDSRLDQELVVQVPVLILENCLSEEGCVSGDPKYGIPVLDPIYVEEVNVQESGIIIIARNFTIEGARDAALQDFR
jgi:hypothetical protein